MKELCPAFKHLRGLGGKDFRASNGVLKQQFKSGLAHRLAPSPFRLLFDVFGCDHNCGLLLVTILTLIVVSVLSIITFRFRPLRHYWSYGLTGR